MSEAESWTVGRLLTWTTDYLKRHAAASPRLDAEVLLAHARGCQRIELYTAFSDPVAEEARTVFRDLVRRRAAGEPVAYLVGHREFYSLCFEVTPDVLIPRPETEHLVVQAIDLLRRVPDTKPPPRMADVGTGSGAIAVSVARHAQHARITAVDISPPALAVAGRNVQQHGVGDRVELVLSDLLQALPPEPAFELIVSNPPYVSEPEWEQLAVEVREHEPRSALVGGPTGTEVIARLLPQAAQRMRPGGWLLIEISPMIESLVHQSIASSGSYESSATIKDLAGHARVIASQRKS